MTLRERIARGPMATADPMPTVQADRPELRDTRPEWMRRTIDRGPIRARRDETGRITA